MIFLICCGFLIQIIQIFVARFLLFFVRNRNIIDPSHAPIHFPSPPFLPLTFSQFLRRSNFSFFENWNDSKEKKRMLASPKWLGRNFFWNSVCHSFSQITCRNSFLFSRPDSSQPISSLLSFFPPADLRLTSPWHIFKVEKKERKKIRDWAER